MQKNNKILYWLGVPFVALLFVVAKVYPVLPAVMQDEYVYSTESRLTDFANQIYPNYLFSLFYKSTSLCGDGFYSCAKNLNILFFLAMLVFIYLIAARLFSRGIAIAVLTITIVSPIHVYISYFMPETMYFAFMVATVWVTLWAVEKQKLVWWIYSGAMLGLTALVKPHALFALPSLVLIVFIINLRYENGGLKKALLATGANLGAFFVTKFGFGFAFAGVAGLSLFGTSYTNSVSNFIQSPAEAGSNTITDTGAVTEANQSAWSTLTSVSALQLVLHIAFLILIYGVPIFLALSVIKTILMKKDQVSSLSAFVALVGALSLSYVTVTAVFEGFVSALGDNHSNRVITRYYDFLIPLLLLLAFAVDRYVQPKPVVRIIQAAIILAGSIWFWVYFPTHILPRFADSVTIRGLSFSPAILIVVALIGIAALIIWLIKSDIGTKVISFVTVPLVVLILGFAAQASLLQSIGTTKGYFDIAGQAVKPYIQEIPGSEIVVIGRVRTEVFTAMFWMDKANIHDLTITEGQGLSLESIKDFDYALLLGTDDPRELGETVTSGDRYVLVKLTK